MARPIRIEYPGAAYHITSRGNARQKIFHANKDYSLFLSVLIDTIDRYNWICYSYCLMPNHYHLFIETVEPNLSSGMRQLNGVFTQKFNIFNHRSGHLFQGRFKAALVEKESYFGEVLRYIALNPVKAKLAASPETWPWSAHNEIIGRNKSRKIIDRKQLFHHLGGNNDKSLTVYKSLFKQGSGTGFNIKDELKGRFILGSDGFIEKIKDMLAGQTGDREIPKSERYLGRPSLDKLFEKKSISKVKRNEIVHQAYLRYGYTLTEIADHLGCHYSTLSKILNRERKDLGNNSQFKT